MSPTPTDPGVDLVDAPRLAELIAASRVGARRRAHLLLHADHQDSVQRLLIAMQPGTYFRPQRHAEQWEMLAVQHGALIVTVLAADGRLVARHRLEPTTPVIQLPAGTWHSVVVLAPDTIALEIKPGPFRPAEFAPWAPEESTPAAAGMLHWLATAAAGERYSPAA